MSDPSGDLERGVWHAEERRVAFKQLATVLVCGCVSLYIIASYVERFEDWGWLRRRFT